MIDFDEMLDDLLDLEEGLTVWELGLIDTLDKKRLDNPNWMPSEKQRAMVIAIHGDRT